MVFKARNLGKIRSEQNQRQEAEPWDRQHNFEQLAMRKTGNQSEVLWRTSCEQGGPGPLTVRRRWECRADWNGGK